MLQNYSQMGKGRRTIGFSRTMAVFPTGAGTLPRSSPPTTAQPAQRRGHSRSPRSSSSPTPTRWPVGAALRASSRMLLAAPPCTQGVQVTAECKTTVHTSKYWVDWVTLARVWCELNDAKPSDSWSHHYLVSHKIPKHTKHQVIAIFFWLISRRRINTIFGWLKELQWPDKQVKWIERAAVAFLNAVGAAAFII